MERASSAINEGIQKLVGNKFRRSLKEVQLSADKETLVGNNMISVDDKPSRKLKQSKTIEKVIGAEKENIPALRRSKRKTDKVNYGEPPVELKPSKSKNTQPKKTVTKSKKNRSVAANKNDQNVPNQTELNFPLTNDTPKEIACDLQPIPSDNIEKQLTASTGIDEDSGIDPTCGISDHSNNPMNSTVILRTPDIKNSSVVPYDISVIVADNPPLNYWKDLAEQRRVALEKTLHENELLHDELAVLEAENNQLKQLLREAENLAQVVRAIVC